MHRRYLDAMRQQLRGILHEMNEIDLTVTGFAVKLIEVCEEADAWQRMWHDESGRRTSVKTNDGWDATQVENWESILDNPAGVNLATIQDSAQYILGKPLAEVCSKISEHLRILHVEAVFRNDLVAKFMDRQAKIHRDLCNMPYGVLRRSVSVQAITRGSREDNIEGLAAELARQRVTFHGAPHRAIQSIVRYGFTIPGEEIGDTGQQLAIRCGSTYGMGIYSSPDPMFASAYLQYNGKEFGAIRQPADVPGMRLVVCAKLMGRPMIRVRGERDKGGLLSQHAHSHISPDQMQYIVYERTQIIPVYVLHLDYGAETAREEFDRIASNPTFYFRRRREAINIDKVEHTKPECPGDVQRKKQALKAAAAKWFPYGYGPAQGTNFVIEEIAEVSDDEEEYGDLQILRTDPVEEFRAREDGSSWFDEFQTVRKTRHSVKMADS